MSYVALYRQFRPKVFEDVVGQEHITKTLKNQIKSGRVAHAYLFSGGRGSGKTSTAKILSRAVNCLNPKDGEPCNECEICRQALEGTLTDISEIDAASNNGVDNIRDIREEVEFIPTNARYRVYIIDEVHMLSTGAFNALLKTLEEPPKHVIFILATTEPQKLPITILSRCQRFDFKRISVENIIKRLNIICNESHIKIEEGALKIIAKMSDGAMRDAISILERCVADGEDIITEEKVRELVGIPELEYLLEISKNLMLNDAAQVLESAEKIINEGKDLEIFTWELIKFMRDLIMLQISDNLVLYKEDEKVRMRELLKFTDKERLLRLITDLSSLQSSMKWASDREVIFETGLIKIAYEGNRNQMLSHVGISQNVSAKANGNASVPQESNTSDNELKEKVLSILKENRKMIMHTILTGAEIKVASEDLVHIIFGASIDDVNKQYMQKEESKAVIKETVKNALHKEMKIKYVFG
ncbi:MAG: DNA polymerase III subunit gamma/tau [Clostridia bacterium]|nr:DNA polymerase III subunit gamma/tau [Clostridia bacterium]